MIRLQHQLFVDLEKGGPHAVLKSLQDALRLEHATLPLYLYAYYSLDPTKNSAIARIIFTVIMEEMLHMTLVCNIINALDGTPKINDPGLVPQYPGHLPGGVQDDLYVHLAPYSAGQLAAFLQIEQPEHPLKFPEALAAKKPPETIGRFYREIEKQIVALGDGAFVKPPRNQVGSDVISNAIIVTDVKTASQAIDLIVEQGEGTDTDPGEVVGGDYAHYYRFMEIKKTKKLKKNPNAPPDAPPDQKYIYNGDKIPFDPSGVFQAPTDPKAADYPAGSPARAAMDAFNATYSNLLNLLQQGFTGAPMQPAINAMGDLDDKASTLMLTAAPGGGVLGPSFEYLPPKPA
ncbi:MAG: ferritin-like protein [Xanthobacteraceae bacterium]